MLEQNHLLIAGATGSGKSVVVNGIIYNGMYSSPDEFQMILIDPKRVELVAYKDIPHTVAYASEPADMVKALQTALKITENRYTEMQAARVKKYSGAHLYVIIDELADLMTTNRKQVQPLIQRLCQIGRAARVHVIAATQCPLAAVIPTPIKVNFDSRVGLRTRSAQDSRNILGATGCETLPRYGKCYYMTAAGTELLNVPMYTDDEIAELLDYWKRELAAAQTAAA
jgi:S-DNA-T family DNA segregation ATPase FtsK/SpoIIIE